MHTDLHGITHDVCMHIYPQYVHLPTLHWHWRPTEGKHNNCQVPLTQTYDIHVCYSHQGVNIFNSFVGNSAILCHSYMY